MTLDINAFQHYANYFGCVNLDYRRALIWFFGVAMSRAILSLLFFLFSLISAMEGVSEILIVGSGRNNKHIKDSPLNNQINTLDNEKSLDPNFVGSIEDSVFTQSIKSRFATVIFENLPNQAINKTSVHNAFILLKEGGIIVMNYPGALVSSNIPSGEDNLTNKSDSIGSEKSSGESNEEGNTIEKYLEFTSSPGFYHLQKTGTPNDYSVYKHDERMEAFSTAPMRESDEMSAIIVGFCRFKSLLSLDEKLDFELVVKSKVSNDGRGWSYNGNVIWIKELPPKYFIIGKKR